MIIAAGLLGFTSPGQGGSNALTFYRDSYEQVDYQVCSDGKGTKRFAPVREQYGGEQNRGAMSPGLLTFSWKAAI
jgi:hypothetical protein